MDGSQFIASIVGFAGNFAPRSWALCEGQLLAINQNQAVFSLIGTIYGGDGRTTMALPDLRGRAPIGSGRGPGLQDYKQGISGGIETVTLNVTEIPSHNHALDLSSLKVDRPLSTATADTDDPTAGVHAKPVYVQGRSSDPVYAFSTAGATTTKSEGTISGSGTVGLTGGSQAHENRMPYLAINWIFAMEGIYPSRN